MAQPALDLGALAVPVAARAEEEGGERDEGPAEKRVAVQQMRGIFFERRGISNGLDGWGKPRGKK